MTKIYDLSFESALYRDDWDGHYLGKKSTTPDSLVELSQSPHITLPDLLEFETHNPERLRKVNVATANSGVKMHSQKVIDAISSTGDVDWTLIPVRFVDKSNGDEVCEGKFSGVFFEYHSDFFDYERSEYKPRDWSSWPPEKLTDRMRKKVQSVKKMVLKEPDMGFPPCFQLLAIPYSLYISEAAYKAIVRAELTGLRLMESKKIFIV